MRKNHFQGLLSALLLMAASVVMFSSCDSDELSPRLAEKALKDSPQLRDSCLTRTFTTGYYEVSAEDTVKLGQLQRAGVITYSTETIVEKRVHRSYWYGTTVKNIDHIFAKVELTEKGREYEVTNKPVMRSVYEKALGIFDKKDEIKEPAYLNAEAAAVDIKAKKDDAEPATTEETYDVADSAVVATDSVAVDEIDDSDDAPAPVSPTADAYETACSKVNTVEHDMLVANIKIVKVIDVFCPEESRKNGLGECNFVYELTDLTPFAWVYGDKEELHKRNVSSAKFKHTVDQGWYVTSIGDND